MTAAPLREGRAPSGIVANVLLFALTCASTVFAGAFWAGALSAELPRLLAAALPFAITLLAILLAHEFGHYFMARHYGAAVSLPYFIPAPPLLVGSAFVPLFGTLGAIIQMRSIPRDRNSLFDIAAAGPIAGLLVAIPTFVYGLYSATLVRLVPGGIQLGDPLLLQALFYLKFGPIPPNMDVQLPPMALAGWFAFVVTALNLFPVGQLDGGRISYALFGRRHLLVGTGVLLGSVALGVATQSWNWVLWAVVVFFLIGVDHTPPLDDMTPLSRGRRVLGVTCLLLLFLLIPPVPIRLV
jgi:membrane-associated protease RseP (regulator of RpoE activity)